MTGTKKQQSICKSCGICCDGTIFSDLKIDQTGPSPAWPKQVADLVSDDKRLPIPCPAFQKQQCTIYSTRPKICQKYQCYLLKNYVTGNISYEAALTHIQDARMYQAALKKAVAEKFPQLVEVPSKHLLHRLKQLYRDQVGTDDFWKANSKILLTLARLDHHIKSIFSNRENRRRR